MALLRDYLRATTWASTTRPSSRLRRRFRAMTAKSGPRTRCRPSGGGPVSWIFLTRFANHAVAAAVVSSQLSTLKPLAARSARSSSRVTMKLGAPPPLRPPPPPPPDAAGGEERAQLVRGDDEARLGRARPRDGEEDRARDE